MIETTAQPRLKRVMESKTRKSGELLQLATDDLVDFFRKPINKDVSGWRGPARVVNVSNVTDGEISVHWQGRTMPCRIQDLRRTLVYLAQIWFTHYDSEMTDAFTTTVRFAEKLTKDVVRLGWVNAGNNSDKTHWLPTRITNSSHETAPALLEMLRAAQLHFGLHFALRKNRQWCQQA